MPITPLRHHFIGAAIVYATLLAVMVVGAVLVSK